MIAYASRTGSTRNLSALRAAGWRLLVSAAGVWRTEGFPYAIDNGAWSAHCTGCTFDSGRFLALLARLGDGADFVIAPDIVCGGLASLSLTESWLPRLEHLRSRKLIAVQNGITPADIRPLLKSGVGIFVGGDTEWKLTTLPQWGALSAETSAYLHVGRVNSRRRIRLCALAGAHSFDGTSATRFSLTLPHLDLARRSVLPFSGEPQ